MKEVSIFDKLYKYYCDNLLSHVYLIETNNVENTLQDIKKFIKKISCKEKYDENCNKCNICNLIEINNLPSLVIVEPDGSTIKKEQITDLKKRLQTIPIFTENNYYIIKEADKLSKITNNYLLKFIEDPLDNVLGFLITSNLNNVLLTIKSRCEIIKNYYEEENINYYNTDFLKKYLYEIIINKKNITINKEFDKEIIENREEVIIFFKTILQIFDTCLNNENVFLEKYSDFDFINKDKNYLLLKIKLITNIIKSLGANGNIDLILDSFVINMSGDNNESI